MTDINLNCWVLGDGLYNIFELTISPTKSVSTLRKMVYDEINPRSPAKDLLLWKVSELSSSR
jgi:hypothetical protein